MGLYLMEHFNTINHSVLIVCCYASMLFHFIIKPGRDSVVIYHVVEELFGKTAKFKGNNEKVMFFIINFFLIPMFSDIKL